jgi:two-component sensor histidine kinase
MRLISTLVDQLGGKLHIDGVGGTTVAIRFAYGHSAALS